LPNYKHQLTENCSVLVHYNEEYIPVSVFKQLRNHNISHAILTLTALCSLKIHMMSTGELLLAKAPVK